MTGKHTNSKKKLNPFIDHLIKGNEEIFEYNRVHSAGDSIDQLQRYTPRSWQSIYAGHGL